MKDDSLLFADSDTKTGTIDLKDDTLAEIEEEEDDSFNEDDNQLRIFQEETESEANFAQNTSTSLI